MSIVIIDNYDSFTYNLVHYFEEIYNEKPIVYYNDNISFDKLNKFDSIVLSPGPGLPKDSGDLISVIDRYLGKKPMLGICLGHQAIAEYLGVELIQYDEIFHGKESEIDIENNNPLFYNLPSKITVGRYHSWFVNENNLNNKIIPLAKDSNNRLMAFEVKNLNAYGLQFHPESIMTPYGKDILKNWVKLNDKSK